MHRSTRRRGGGDRLPPSLPHDVSPLECDPIGGRYDRSDSELRTTDTDDNAIARPATSGGSLTSMSGYSAPAAIEQVQTDASERHLADVQRGDDVEEVRPHEHDPRGFHGDVRARADADPEVGLHHRGRVVHAVADNGDDAPVPLKVRDGVHFPRRKRLRDDVPDPHGRGHRARDAPVIPAHDRRRYPPGVQRRDRLGRLRSDRVADADDAARARRARDEDDGDGLPAFLLRAHRLELRGRELDAVLHDVLHVPDDDRGRLAAAAEFAAAAVVVAMMQRRAETAAGGRIERREGRQPAVVARAALDRRVHDRARDRVLAPALRARGEPQRPTFCVSHVRALGAGGVHRAGAVPSEGARRGHRRGALRERPGLVEHDVRHPVRGLQRRPAFDEDAHPRAEAGADHHRGRRREPERARARDHEHGDGEEERK
eukprot:31287-Pelagococcus_subviridis.AAC.3